MLVDPKVFKTKCAAEIHLAKEYDAEDSRQSRRAEFKQLLKFIDNPTSEAAPSVVADMLRFVSASIIHTRKCAITLPRLRYEATSFLGRPFSMSTDALALAWVLVSRGFADGKPELYNFVGAQGAHLDGARLLLGGSEAPLEVPVASPTNKPTNKPTNNPTKSEYVIVRCGSCEKFSEHKNSAGCTLVTCPHCRVQTKLERHEQAKMTCLDCQTSFTHRLMPYEVRNEGERITGSLCPHCGFRNTIEIIKSPAPEIPAASAQPAQTPVTTAKPKWSINLYAYSSLEKLAAVLAIAKRQANGNPTTIIRGTRALVDAMVVCPEFKDKFKNHRALSNTMNSLMPKVKGIELRPQPRVGRANPSKDIIISIGLLEETVQSLKARHNKNKEE